MIQLEQMMLSMMQISHDTLSSLSSLSRTDERTLKENQDDPVFEGH